MSATFLFHPYEGFLLATYSPHSFSAVTRCMEPVSVKQAETFGVTANYYYLSDDKDDEMSESELSATPSTDSDGFQTLHEAFLASGGSYNDADSEVEVSPWSPKSPVYVPASPELANLAPTPPYLACFPWAVGSLLYSPPYSPASPTFSPSSPIYPSARSPVFSPISPVYTPASPIYPSPKSAHESPIPSAPWSDASCWLPGCRLTDSPESMDEPVPATKGDENWDIEELVLPPAVCRGVNPLRGPSVIDRESFPGELDSISCACPGSPIPECDVTNSSDEGTSLEEAAWSTALAVYTFAPEAAELGNKRKIEEIEEDVGAGELGIPSHKRAALYRSNL
ncbi:hypothetical protein IAR50_005596 [Cryptococcus sp. DSM 104548]